MLTSGSGPVTVGAGCTGPPTTLCVRARGATSSPHPTAANTVAAMPAHRRHPDARTDVHPAAPPSPTSPF